MPLAIVLHDRKTSRFAVNALAAALEAHPASRDLEAVAVRSTQGILGEARRAIAAGRRALVAWSFTTASFGEVRDELALVRAAVRGPAVVHVAGGPHASAAPGSVLAAGFDLAALGEGEETLPRLAAALAAGSDPRDIRGLAWLDRGRVRTSGRADAVDLEIFPAFAPRAGRVGPIEITRGCAWACRFCQTPFLFRAGFRHRSLEAIRRAIRYQVEAAGRDVRFLTPSALSWGSSDAGCDLAAVEALLASAREIAGSRRRVLLGTFPSELRPEHVSPRALAILRRYCDNRIVIVGGQSGSNRLLERMARGHDAEAVLRAAALAREAGFRPSVDLVFGLPGEIEEDRAATRRQMERLARIGARVHAHAFDPLPGTPWAREPPGRIDPETAQLLARLHASGRAYGEWRGHRPDEAEARPKPCTPHLEP